MDQKALHEAATSILAKVLELSYDDAIKKIDKECGDNNLLKDQVLELYREINEDDAQSDKDSYVLDPTKTTQRIGKQNSELRSKIVHNWIKILFGNKRNRLILIITFLVILATAGIISRNIIRQNMLDAEREVKIALLNANKEILERWIFFEKKKIVRWLLQNERSSTQEMEDQAAAYTLNDKRR